MASPVHRLQGIPSQSSLGRLVQCSNVPAPFPGIKHSQQASNLTRALFGPECTRGQTAGRAGGKKERARQVDPPRTTNAEQNRATKGKQQQDHHGQQNPRHENQNKQKREKTRATKGKPKQVEASTPYFAVPNVPPKENNQEGVPKRTRGRTVGCQETRRKTKLVENELKSTSAPCGQTHKYKSSQDQDMGGPKQM